VEVGPLEEALQSLRDEEKSAASWWVTWVWIVTGVYLFVTTQDVSLFSFSALVFLGAGMFAAVTVFAIGGYSLLRLVGITTVAMHRWKWVNVYSKRMDIVTRTLGFTIFAAEIACTVLGARWAFHKFVA
jgi:hypothetical protein